MSEKKSKYEKCKNLPSKYTINSINLVKISLCLLI